MRCPALILFHFSPSDETFDLGLRFELVMEVRPRVASGVLLHVPSEEGYFTIYIHRGEVRPYNITRGSFSQRCVRGVYKVLCVFRWWFL